MTGSGPVRRSRFAFVDLVDESLAGLLSRPGRSLLTAAGTVLGIAALVAIAGLTSTAGNHIVSRFDALAATEVVVTTTDEGSDASVSGVIPWDAEARLSRLNGVVAAGTMTTIDLGGALVRTNPIIDPLGRTEFQLDVVAASPGLLGAVQGVIGTGRWFDRGHDERGDRVAVVGRAAADRLGLVPLDRQPAVFVGDETLTVIGVLADVGREAQLLDAVIIPDGTARGRFGLQKPESVHLQTALGAGRLIGAQAPLVLAPHAPGRLTVRLPPDPEEVRASVADDVRSLFLLLGALSLVIGGFGIANTTLVGVLERTAEIGLRRTLGARRRHIAAQFLLESTTVGILGGVVGASLGVLTIVGVSAIKSWTPVLEPWLPVAAVAAGALMGLAAGTYPSWRATRIQPIAALRSEV